MSARDAWRRVAGSLVVFVAACDACASSSVVAELATVVERVERDFVGRETQWSAAPVGATLVVGEGVRTGPSARAELRLVPEGILRVEAATIVRFQDQAPGAREPRLSVETGTVELETLSFGAELSTPAGIARVGGGSRVRLVRGERELRGEVVVGRLELERGGERLVAGPGERFSIDVGRLEIERVALDRPAEPTEGPPPEPVDAAPETQEQALAVDRPATLGGAALRFDEPPEVMHFAVPAGESATIHDPRTPTHVRVEFAACPNGGAVEVARGGGALEHARVRGDRGATLRLAAGNYRYRVRCFEGVGLARGAVAQGSLQVRRDAGTRRLPRVPPSVDVDVDGRRYTVRYQNLLPRLTLRWPGAPKSVRYTLAIQTGAGGRLERHSREPVVTLASGELEEGVHELVFSAGEQSVRGSLRIAFDNTARTAYLSAPADGAVRSGQSVRFVGAALADSRVSVLGKPVALGEQGRFAAEIEVPADAATVTIRVQHPASGVHYYVRHVAP